MDTYIPGSMTDFGALIVPYIYSFPFPQRNGRYKDRLQHDPEARCVGIDMNRYVQSSSYLSNVFMNGPILGIGWGFSRWQPTR